MPIKHTCTIIILKKDKDSLVFIYTIETSVFYLYVGEILNICLIMIQ